MTLKKKLYLIILSLTYFVDHGRSSHLLDTDSATGKYISIQDQVIESCRGHFMCEVFPYLHTHGLVCLHIKLVCDGVPHCRDGVDEIPSVCQGLRRSRTGRRVSSSGSTNKLRGSLQQLVVSKTPPSHEHGLKSLVPNTHSKMTAAEQVSVNSSQTPLAAREHVAYNFNNGTGSLSGHDDIYVHRSKYRETPIKRLQLDPQRSFNFASGQQQRYQSVSPRLGQNAQGLNSHNGPGLWSQNRLRSYLGLNPTKQSDVAGGKRLFSHFAQYRGMQNNILGNGLGMWFQSKQQQETPSFAEYYGVNKRRIEAMRNTQPALGDTFQNIHATLQHTVPVVAVNTNPVKEAAGPGSSYQDTTVTPPQIHSPDGIIHVPGQEPHLLQEENFLEQQFYLTNVLDGSQVNQQGNESAIGQGTSSGQNEHLPNEMLIGKQRQEQLLRNQFMGWNENQDGTDLNTTERYGLSGPFDGGFPTSEGDVTGVNTMEGTEAQNAIHTLEAIH